MSDSTKPKLGSIAWIDLTVPAADEIRDFYSQVVGWESSPVDMGGYEDFNMTSPGSDEPQAGICHARGVNSDLPSAWLVYFVVADAAASARRCVELGGEVLVPPRGLGSSGSCCVVRDPAGAVAALYSVAATDDSPDEG